MRVTIKKPATWFGPYQLTALLKYVGVPESVRDKIADYISDMWLGKFLTWLHTVHDANRISVHVDPWDSWSVDDTLAAIIVPLLKQLKRTKHGSPMVDMEDVPEHLRSHSPGPYGFDEKVHDRWDYVLDEMIWAFEQVVLQTEDQFIYPSYDEAAFKEHRARCDNGRRLFAKYYEALWD